jgi:antitoxin ChpS
MAFTHILDPATERVARSFLAEVKRQYDVAGAYVFGSQARGDAQPDSDTDVAIILHGLPGRRLNEAMNMADIAYELIPETGIRVEALPLWESEWEHPETFNNPSLIENIRREGVKLWPLTSI